jgi:transposase
MSAPRKYPQELRDRAVRMVFEIRQQTGGQPGAIVRVANQLGVHREALRNWVRQAEVDAGQRPGVPTAEQQRIPELEREVRELRRANEILKAASAFFRGRARPSPDEVTRMIDAHRERFGVEPICRVLEVPTSTDYAHTQDQPAARTRRDAQLKAEIERIWKEHFEVSGAGKLWRPLQREGIGVARCPWSGCWASLACRVWCVASRSGPRWLIRRPSGPPTWSAATSPPSGPTSSGSPT